ncbi:MAG: hypothetical protein MJ225_00630 [Bacilli bacterium]|nr:hypothetical protein [Bacilli bacterium]
MVEAKQTKKMSPYLIVLLSLVGIIFAGTFLLSLPVSHLDGEWGKFLDSLFISTSATCVTGLSVYTNGIAGELTIFGQVIMLLMIQIGGLGFITILTFVISLFIRRLKFKDRLFLSQAINSTNIADVGKFAIRVVIIVVIAETLGFLLGLPVFLNIKQYSTGEALWKCLFTSVSAFNNAGFDVFGNMSLIKCAENPALFGLSDTLYYYLLFYIMFLIILGGLSFVAIIDIFFSHKKVRQYSAFTKIVLVTTATLIVLGTVIFLLTDATKGNMNFIHCMFQSVTCRTAGFCSVDQDTLSVAGKTFSSILMFIGGSPISTAGGIKTSTIFMIVLCFFCFLKGKKVVAFKREFSRTSILKAMSVVFLALIILLVSFSIIGSLEEGNPQASAENIFFEIFSAFGTTGLSANLTTTLTNGSRIILCLLMFFGRLGPITIFQIFEKHIDNEDEKHYKNIETNIIVG